MDNKYFGEKIKEYRKRAKLSQAQLAELVDLSDKHIGRIESGKYSPSIKNFIKIIKVLNIDISILGLNNYNKSKDYNDLINLIDQSNPKEISLFLKMIKLLKENK